MIGRLLGGRYKVIQNLSYGGFGHTYIAEDIHIPGNPKCVVKQLQPSNNDPRSLATARRLFQGEAETLAQLGNHDQIPRILAYFEENQEFFLVEELIDGQTLADELTPRKQLSESSVIALLKDVLPILEFIHQHGVIHRDIKPANIIRRNSDSKLVLIDFGAVKQVFAVPNAVTRTQQDSATVAIGTSGYMPTEQGQGKPRLNSDIYALGMIAIQALTGIYPKNLEEDSQTGEIIWQNRVSVSPGLVTILTQMVRFYFKDRYQSAGEVLTALEQLNNPNYSPTIPNPVTTTNSLRELTLDGREAGQTKTYRIEELKQSNLKEHIDYFATIGTKVLKRLGVTPDPPDSRNPVIADFSQNGHLLWEQENTKIYSFCTDQPWLLPFDALVIPSSYRITFQGKFESGGFARAFIEFLGEKYFKIILKEINKITATNQRFQLSPKSPLFLALPEKIKDKFYQTNTDQFLIFATVESLNASVSGAFLATQELIFQSDAQDINCIVLPLLGTGDNQLSIDKVAKAMLSAIAQSLTILSYSSIEKIIIVNNKSENIHLINQIAKE